MILSSKKVLPSDPGDLIELTTLHYLYPFLPYFPAFWHGQPFLCPEINHPPGLQVSTISNSVHFTDTRAIPSKSVILCLRDVIYDMNDENRINWNEVKAYLKAANVTEATNMGIHTNPMPQHQGGQVTTQGPTPVQTNPGPSAIHQLPLLFVYFQEVLTRPFF